MIGPSSGAPLPGIVSQYNDRLGRIYGSDTLEANWFEERLQLEAGALKQPSDEQPVLRPFEPELSAHQKHISGGLAICSRQKRYPFMFQSRSIVSDGAFERLSMSETFFKPLHERPPNPVGAGKTTAHDAMLMQFAQRDEPKTRQNKDRMSNIEHEVRPVADSEEKIRKHFIHAANLGHSFLGRPSHFSARIGFGAVVPKHPEGYAQRHFSTTTGEALSTGLLRPESVPGEMPFSSGGYEKTATNHTVFTFGFAKMANAQLPGMGTREHFGKTSLIKSLEEANNPSNRQPGRPFAVGAS
ncbi:hypothetical protein KFE25_013542 [Diacronema lutheri]|uniref:Uncharacterized protein n=1 Tax=Diacronema lutheri TaxID=2081491 RepID=A0A8J6CDC5_DIALT|nr:hypothetical protein KFE25_013542 [Diacronema lutheri]